MALSTRRRRIRAYSRGMLAITALLSVLGCGGSVDVEGSAAVSGSGSGSSSSSGSGGGGMQQALCAGKACGDECYCQSCADIGHCSADGECLMGPIDPGMCGSTCDPSVDQGCDLKCSGAICDVLDDGPWLIGWGAGMDHFSWVRFTYTNASKGSIDVLDPVCASCDTYFGCEGPGSFWIGLADSPEAPGSSSILMTLPADCAVDGSLVMRELFFTMIAPADGFPKNAVLLSSVVDEAEQQWMEGYQYPSSHCDAGFTMCADPFE